MKGSRNARRAIAIAIFSAGLAACAANAETPEVISIAVPPEGSSGYLIATGYSSHITERTEATKVLLQTFGGSGNWPALMNRAEVDLGQHCGFEQMKEAYTGTGAFEQLGPQTEIRTLATGYGLPWGVHVADEEVRSFADLKGKSIFVQVSHNDHVIAMREMLAHAGLDYDSDVTILPFQSPQEAVQGMMTGRGDAMAFGLIPALAEIARSRGLHTLPVDAEAIDRVKTADPVWGDVTIPAGFGPLQPADAVPLLQLQCGLAAGAHLSEDAVYEITKALYESHSDWVDVSPLARQWTPEKAVEIKVVPFHDGAIRYFREIGVWDQ